MSRVDNLPENALAQTITSLQQNASQLKGADQFIGSDSITMYANQTANTWDVTLSVAAYATVKWRVTFTPTYMKNVYANATYHYTINNADSYESEGIYPDVNNTSSTSRSWVVVYNNDANVNTLQYKFYVLAPDTGTITWVQL